MAGKTTNMSTIKQLLLLRLQDAGIKTIARTLGMSKNTVKDYLQKLHTLQNKGDMPFTIDALVQMPEPQLEALFHAGNPAYKDDRYAYLKERVSYFGKELKRTGVNRKLLWQEYRNEHPDGYGYTQFCFHLNQLLHARKPTMVLTHAPGDKLYIDFAGKKLSYTDRVSGEVKEAEVFVACMPYSDFSFVMAVPSQSSTDFIFALTCCLQQLGGVPQAIVSDNLKAAVTRACKFEPDINKLLIDLANHYGTTILPARARRPRDKALVENHVGLIYSRVYAKLRNQVFFDLPSLNKAIAACVKDHNQTRMQQKPFSREERFLADEKPLLKPLPEESFEVKHYRQLKVAQNNHFYLSADKHYYSVPFVYIGQLVKVMYTRTMVFAYHNGEQIACHVRSYQQGGYTSLAGHLCSQHRHVAQRSPQYYLAIAQKCSSQLHQLFEYIFAQNRYPEQLYKTCDGLLHLQRKSAPAVFAKACQMAIDYEQYNYRFVHNVLANKMTELIPDTAVNNKPLPEHQNLRGKEYFQQSLLF
jgi:transposase